MSRLFASTFFERLQQRIDLGRVFGGEPTPPPPEPEPDDEEETP